jgi:hypothetical protein
MSTLVAVEVVIVLVTEGKGNGREGATIGIVTFLRLVDNAQSDLRGSESSSRAVLEKPGSGAFWGLCRETGMAGRLGELRGTALFGRGRTD